MPNPSLLWLFLPAMLVLAASVATRRGAELVPLRDAKDRGAERAGDDHDVVVEACAWTRACWTTRSWRGWPRSTRSSRWACTAATCSATSRTRSSRTRPSACRWSTWWRSTACLTTSPSSSGRGSRRTRRAWRWRARRATGAHWSNGTWRGAATRSTAAGRHRHVVACAPRPVACDRRPSSAPGAVAHAAVRARPCSSSCSPYRDARPGGVVSHTARRGTRSSALCKRPGRGARRRGSAARGAPLRRARGG